MNELHSLLSYPLVFHDDIPIYNVTNISLLYIWKYDHIYNVIIAPVSIVLVLPPLLNFDFLHVELLQLHILDHPVGSQPPLLLAPLIFYAHSPPVLHAQLLVPLECHAHLHYRIEVGSNFVASNLVIQLATVVVVLSSIKRETLVSYTFLPSSFSLSQRKMSSKINAKLEYIKLLQVPNIYLRSV